MATSLVIGAGAVGRALAGLLASRGARVRVATRSGTQVPHTEAVRLDAADAAEVTRAARGVETMFLCTNPPYPAWQTEWPPIITAAIAAAAATEARVVLMGNLYAYGKVKVPMREDTPLHPCERKGAVRRSIWNELLAAHRTGRIQATEVRASDYFGPGAGANAHLGPRFFGPLAASKTAWVLGNPSLSHSWAYLPDIAATLAAASAETAMGSAWHVPHSTHLDRLSIAAQANSLLGSTGRVRSYPPGLIRAGGTLVPLLRELQATSYQFTSDFTAESEATETALGVHATDFQTALETSLRDLLPAPAR